MPFRSKRQERAAFSGALGPKMKAAAPQWAAETQQLGLPERAPVNPMKTSVITKAMKTATAGSTTATTANKTMKGVRKR